MSSDRLTPLQKDLLRCFFRLESRFFLTGGAALAGFHLGHRETHDLDFFAPSSDERILDDGDAALARAAAEIGGGVEHVTTAPDFRRRKVTRGDASVIVDLIRDRTPQIAEKQVIAGAIVDPPREIFANKLCTLLSRSELRDLVDTLLLERSGLSLEEGIRDASMKDAGMSPATLSWVLSQVQIPDGAAVPGDVTAAELRSWVDDLRRRLGRLAWPAS